MKNVIIIFTTLLFIISGCKEKEEVEIIPDYDKVYLPLNKVDSTPQIVEGNEEEFSGKINDELKKSDGKEKLKLDYKILIDEKGNVEKIQVVESPGEKFNKIVAEEIKDWKFEPAMKDAEPVKSQYRWKFNKGITKDSDEINPDEFFVTADKMPMPVGGLQAIQQNVIYPEIAKKAGIEGKVIVMAYIDTTGSVVKTEILKGIGSGLDEAAMNAIEKTKFTPGVDNDKNIKTKVTIPIVFRLQ